MAMSSTNCYQFITIDSNIIHQVYYIKYFSSCYHYYISAKGVLSPVQKWKICHLRKMYTGLCRMMQKLEVVGNKRIMLLQTGTFTFWRHQMMNFVHKIDIQGALLRFILVLMGGKCSGYESKCAPSTWSRPSLPSKMDFYKGFHPGL